VLDGRMKNAMDHFYGRERRELGFRDLEAFREALAHEMKGR